MTPDSFETSPDEPENVLLPLIGQLAWLVQRGHGSFLTIEFGSPHLVVREPIAAPPDREPLARKMLARRRVFITGDWHFWVEHSDWQLSVRGDTVASEDMDRARVDECLKELDGQRLLSVKPGDPPHSVLLEFDLEASLRICPASYASDEDAQWSLYVMDGDILSYRTDGRLDRETQSGEPLGQPSG